MSDTTPPTRYIGPGRRQRDGSYVFESCFSPESFKAGAQCYLPPNAVIPVVFVPGIMGSNIKVKPDCADKVRKVLGLRQKTPLPNAWRPPNGLGEANAAAKDYKRYRPQKRQALLNPEWTEVDPGGHVEVPGGNFLVSPDGSLDGEREARKRGWGTVHWMGYGPMLLALEEALNAPSPLCLNGNIRHWTQLLDRFQGEGGSPYAPFHVKPEELRKIDAYQFPVYAVGYNWTQSNLDSAKHLKEKIAWIMDRYSKELGYTCQQVIVVTHSMGGIVARVCAKHLKMESKILGVIHGVMPAVGAPEAYRRCVAGLGKADSFFTVMDIMKLLMGPSAEHTTPVMANSPGCLELLPSHLYPKGWLQVHQNGGKEPVLSLPQSDPYEEIYKRDDVWYRLVDPKLLDPAGVAKPDGNPAKGARAESLAWAEYQRRVTQVAKFHREILGKGYHKNTYAFHSEGLFTHGVVRWRFNTTSLLTPNDVKKASPGTGNLQGNQELIHNHQGFSAWIEYPEKEMKSDPHRWSGDGTVPGASGEAPGHHGVSRIYRLKGFKHAGAYQEEFCQAVTLWAVLNMLPEKS